MEELLLEELLEKITKFEKVDEFENGWYEINEIYIDKENNEIYDIVRDVESDNITIICTLEDFDDECMIKEILWKI
jgi:hypothetical protein